MSLVDTIKKRVPLAGDPTPRADVSASDFEDMDTESAETDSDATQQNDDGGSNGNQPEQSDGQSGDQTDSSTESEGGSGDSTDTPDNNSPDSNGQSSLTDFNSTGDEADTSDDGAESGDETDGETDGKNGETDGDTTDDGTEDQPGSEDEHGDTSDGSGSDTDDTDGDDQDSDAPTNGDDTDSPDSDSDEQDTDETDNTDESTGGGESPDTNVEPDNSSPSPPGFGEDPYEPHPDLVESEKNRTDQEKKDLEDELEKARQEHEKLNQALSDNSGSGRLNNIKFNVNPESTSASGTRWNEVTSRKDRILRLLATHLKRERRDSWQRGQTKGRLDSKRLHAVKAKRLDVMKKRDPGKEKRYSAVIVLDRSGSMSGPKINIAEQALATYALALEELGIDVMVMDMYQNDARIISPFGVDIEHAKDDLMSQKASRGTPLSDALEVARKRMELASEEPFLITITDGNPNNADRYQEQLSKTYMPVMGITIKPNGRFDNPPGRRTGPHEQYYDMHTYVGSQEELEQQLEQLTMQIAF